MEVICIEDAALIQLVREVVQKLRPEFGQEPAEWIDGQEAMGLLRCKKTKLQSLRNDGMIEYSQPSKKIILYNRTSILNYLRKYRKEQFHG